jgi:hypothetical protein
MESARAQILLEGPGLGFEPRQKAPQASRLPSYLTSATFCVAWYTFHVVGVIYVYGII